MTFSKRAPRPYGHAATKPQRGELGILLNNRRILASDWSEPSAQYRQPAAIGRLSLGSPVGGSLPSMKRTKRLGLGRPILAVALLIIAAAACQSAPRYADLNADLWRIGLAPIPAVAPAARVSAEQAVARIEMDFPGAGFEPVRVGRRWAIRHNTGAWVVVFRLGGAGDWSGRVLNDQSGDLLFTFHAGSLSDAGITLPDW